MKWHFKFFLDHYTRIIMSHIWNYSPDYITVPVCSVSAIQDSKPVNSVLSTQAVTTFSKQGACVARRASGDNNLLDSLL